MHYHLHDIWTVLKYNYIWDGNVSGLTCSIVCVPVNVSPQGLHSNNAQSDTEIIICQNPTLKYTSTIKSSCNSTILIAELYKKVLHLSESGI